MPAQTVIKVRRDSAADWTSANPTLAEGEHGYETDTGKFKIGTGSTAWTSLVYANGGGAIPQSQVTDLGTALAGKVDEVNGAVTTASTSSTVVRNITLSTSDPSGGMDGDVWLKYTP